ncbi:MAG TPA: chemotaxis-specific protein-glutamate methyltransferase CheB [Syntrophorhabdaceae bacterium]|nr:chemotaxis-specific protein-glutamate methyltransferase CheB [Syntrophorhabdaceae bacterium]HOT41815.1 chemotaxis-specific protein-glutamate methyltransferase CheB [Syntrophorhabdaceae bacterium]HPC66375.1 chemotaxis-specific protein-glutamate methyltransferase CheB [Syntrophorhabdaceae bacterium]HQE80232.1 chemotaxis-specific protein-glutamate methyltransferase CheB [Syntrophorhabdaceae bacterium]HQH43353.1 chemotaxis-specific protein-glutamate methyltransferase CheB [Syntrophorhabdaceae ba
MHISIVSNNTKTIEIIKNILCSQPRYIIAWIAHDGKEAVDKAIKDSPELILMGLDLGIMDGVQATGLIMRERPCPILILTDGISKDAARIFEAMGNGALDAAVIPFMDANGHLKGKDELLKKIYTIEKLIKKGDITSTDRDKGQDKILKPPHPLVAIGSSTGGPGALGEVISRLPSRIGAPIVIIQHVDIQFAHGLVEWLGGKTGLRVMVAEKGIKPEKDTIYVAATNDHLILDRDLSFTYTKEPKDNPYRPSVDEFFYSLLDNWQWGGVAVLLTGMGRDGAKGMLKLKKAGWYTIAQDEKTSIVYGMPKAAVEIGAIDEILPLEDIAHGIVKYLKRLMEGNIYE